MKKNYVLLLWMLFMASCLSAQTTQTFESSTVNVANFTSGGKTFNLSSNAINFTVVELQYYGYNQSDRFIQVSDLAGGLPGTYGQSGKISATGSFKLNNLWVYLTGDSANQNPNQTLNGQPGTVTFRGRLGGALQFTVTKTYASGAANTNPLAAGFNYIDFATEGGSNNTNTLIDELEIQLSGNYDYFAIDDFTWTANTSPTIATSGTLNNFFACAGTSAAQQSFTASGSSLSGNITVTAPTGYELATVSGGPYTGTIALTQTSGSVASTTVYVRTTAGATGNPGGNISLTSASATSVAVAVTSTINAAITSTGSQTNVSCNGGSNGTATVIPSGGAGGYTYAWSPSGGTGATATGLAAGNYTVTITDNLLCQTTRNFTITQPVALGATTSQTNVSCNGGSNGTATASVTGGTPGYTYSWVWTSGGGAVVGTTASITGRPVGSYTVTVTDANSCSITRNVIIVQPTALSAGTSQTNIACNGGATGALAVTPSGGTPGYTYLWTTGATTSSITGLSAGTYSVTITDANSCTATRNFTITQPTAITATTSQTNVSCNGGSNGTATAIPAGGAGSYTYSWSPSGGTGASATGLAPGNYTVTVTDANACQITRNFTITQPTAITATTSQTNVSCNGGSNGTATVTPTGGAGAYTYSWAPSGGTGATASGLAAGTYTVTITDANTCQTTRTVTITQPASAVSGTTVVTNIACNGGSNGAINLTPTGGTGPYTFNWGGGITTEDRTGLAAGSYSVTITDVNGCTGTVSGITITQPASAVSGTTVVTNVACNTGTNGAINLTPTGGTGPYTFNWGGGITTEDRTGLAAGTYSVTITDVNGCTGTVSGITITQPAAAVSGTTVVTNIACNGGTTGAINLTPTGGTGPYTFNWGGGITTEDRTGLAAGTYTVTITEIGRAHV